jgi:prepilin-type N-terminal cleavage/methylation domain-containing protein
MLRSLLRDRFFHSTLHPSEELNTPQKSAGFTLIEVMVALFVFLIIMLAMSQTFTQTFAGYRNVKAVQRDVENAQFALNLMAKELRTSTWSAPRLQRWCFMISQSICFEYEIAANQLTVAKEDGLPVIL